jgi:hypothetical protein
MNGDPIRLKSHQPNNAVIIGFSPDKDKKWMLKTLISTVQNTENEHRKF